MRTFEIVPNQFSLADLLSWQREGTLDLNPPFQRRSVWKLGAKGLLVDTLARGLPVPLIFLRERLELKSRRMRREVVDGQQRLRTMFSFVDPKSLADFDKSRDCFTVRHSQNREMAGKPFGRLDPGIQQRILSYKFSVQVLPSNIDDREILQIFARLNSTGTRLNEQELLNAAFFGEFKTTMFDLGYEQFERWRNWKLLSDEQLSRMTEVALVSDLVCSMMLGLSARSKPRIKGLYAKYDETFDEGLVVASRFRRTMDAIDDLIGDTITSTVFSREIHFYSLFVFLYDLLWGLGSPMVKTGPVSIPHARVRRALLETSRRFREQDVPREVEDAVARSSTDVERRRTRLTFMQSILEEQKA